MFRLKKIIWLFFSAFYLVAGLSYAASMKEGLAYYDNKQFDKAFPIIEKEARRGNAYAQFLTGVMYSYGKGTSKDLKCAIYWYTQGAEQGNPKAQNNLANLYRDGIGVRKNLKKAFKLYSLSAKQGTDAAQYGLGVMYRNGDGVQQDYVKAFHLFKQAATQGDKLAQHALGIAYQNGEGVPANRDEAIKWYKKAAEQGYARSMANLGSLYYPEDAGDLESWDEAYKWYSMAIDHGDRKNAPLGLGLIHLFGSGRYPVDNAKAYSLFTLAAENGRADGWYWLGVMEEYGFGRPQNEEKAMELYKKAAESGVEPAINRLEHGHQDWSLHLFKAIRPLFATPYY